MQIQFLKNSAFTAFFLLLICSSCGTHLPKKPLERTKQVKIDYEILNSELNIQITSLLNCPVRILIKSSQDLPWELVQLKPRQDTLLITPWKEALPEITFGAKYGDPSLPVIETPVKFPFSRDEDIKVLQGYNGSFTHNHDQSQFALDFSLPVGDTLYAATSGYVVEMMEGYKYGGNDDSWTEYGNKILYYDPQTNRFFLYSHLVQNGSFVTEGEYIEAGQPIGLSGNTGYSTTPHLHFAVLIAAELPNNFKSIPFDFVGGYKGEQFKKNSVLPKQ